MTVDSDFCVRILPHGEATIYSRKEGETFHCGLGPVAEAKLLYVDQLNLNSKWMQTSQASPYVVWDVGLGAAANSMAVLESWNQSESGHLHLISFDRTLSPLKCALAERSQRPDHFKYLENLPAEMLQNLCYQKAGEKKSITWDWIIGEFVEGLATCLNGKRSWAVPHAVLYDSYSPARNYEMWKLDHWKNLYLYCQANDTTVVSYSRATGARVTMMLAGFFLGRGCATGEKDETTLASTKLSLLTDPLNHRWLERVKRSHTSHPFTGEHYESKPITEAWLKNLEAHHQFKSSPIHG